MPDARNPPTALDIALTRAEYCGSEDGRVGWRGFYQLRELLHDACGDVLPIFVVLPVDAYATRTQHG